MKECQTEEGGSDVDIEPFIKHEMMKTQKSKCILACINDKIGYVSLSLHQFFYFSSYFSTFSCRFSKFSCFSLSFTFIFLLKFLHFFYFHVLFQIQTTNGQLNVDKALELSKKAYGNDDDKATKWNNAAKQCTDLKSADRCDRAEELVMCTILKITSEGLNPKDFIL